MATQLAIKVTLCDANALWVDNKDQHEYELRSVANYRIEPGESAMVSTGLEIALPPGMYGVIGAASPNYDVVSRKIRYDDDYEPRVLTVRVRNQSPHTVHVEKGSVVALVRVFLEHTVHVVAKAPAAPPPTMFSYAGFHLPEDLYVDA